MEIHAGHAGTKIPKNAPIPPLEALALFAFTLHVFKLKLYIRNVKSNPNNIENMKTIIKLVLGITENHKSKFCKPPVANV